jgi:hypothetical protein
MFEQRDFALKSSAQPGDSAFLLNSGRHQLDFDAFAGRYHCSRCSQTGSGSCFFGASAKSA